MIVGGQTEARAQLSSTIIDYHEPFDQGLNRSSYLWSASPRANLSRTSSNILSPRTVITCLTGRQEQKKNSNTLPCIQQQQQQQHTI